MIGEQRARLMTCHAACRFALTRRAVLALAALPRLRPGRWRLPAAPPRMERLLLRSPRPWQELALACAARRLRAPLRVAVRPHPAWWPHACLLPDRWQAWIEFASRTVLLVECAPRGTTETERPERISAVTRAVAAALRREGTAAADFAASTA